MRPACPFARATVRRLTAGAIGAVVRWETCGVLTRLVAIAELDERPDAAATTRARADGGDDDNAWLLEQWRSGALLLARVTLTGHAEGDDGAAVHAERVITGVWLERDDPPGVEEQVADVAPAELPALARELRDRGVAVDDGRLDTVHLHVELGARLRAALVAEPAG